MVMSLVQSAKLHEHDPWAYLNDVLQRLQGNSNNRIDALLQHLSRTVDDGPITLYIREWLDAFG